MNNTKLIAEYYKDGGECAKIYRVIKEMDGDNSYYSVTFKSANGDRISRHDYPFKQLGYVEDLAEDWSQGLELNDLGEQHDINMGQENIL